MKQTMIWAIMAVAAIIIMSSFNLHLFPAATPIPVPESAAGTALYVCPVASSTWDNIARGMGMFSTQIIIGFIFVLMLILAVWGWAMYQNLLNDKFDRKSFSNPWSYTKMAFWAGVVVLILMMTPNHFRRVTISGASGEWVLCENNTPDARAVRASAVHAH